jgi:hypothetical protein
MTKGRALAVLLVLAAFLSWPCRTSLAVKGVDLAVSFSAKTLTDNLFTNMTYRFKTGPGFEPIVENERVTAQFLRRGEVLIRDEFEPLIPTSKWRPGREYSFSRRIYIPPFIDEYDPTFKGSESLKLNAGLVLPGDMTGASRTIIHRRNLRIVPGSESSVVYLSGWYELETEAGNPVRSYRWTSREARCLIDNPGRDALLVLRGSVDRVSVPGQKVTLSIDGRIMDQFSPDEPEFERSYVVGTEWVSADKDFILSIAVDRTFVPAKVVPGSHDERELGVRISLVYFK